MTASRARKSDIGSDLEKSRIGIRRSRGCAPALLLDFFGVIAVSFAQKISTWPSEAFAPHKFHFGLPGLI
jgi:hypothetical protein